MGLTDQGSTLVAPKPKGIIDPATGKPVGADDRFFGEIGWFGFWSMMVFLAVLTIGFIYEWKKGALEWE